MYVEEIMVVTPVIHVENQGYFFGSVNNAVSRDYLKP